jgi:hypothetical protein
MEMSDEHEIQTRLAPRMDEAFCAGVRAAIDTGLESAPLAVGNAGGFAI